MKEETLVTKSANETQKLARKIAKNFKGDEVLALFGNLGSGKTTFVQGLARGLGIKERMISPTFIIIRKHKFNGQKFYHVDLYRVHNDKQIEEELKELFKSRNRIIAIEWAEKIQNILPEKRINIFFTNLGGDKRKITIWKR